MALRMLPAVLVGLVAVAACSDPPGAWLVDPQILVAGVGVKNDVCTTDVCPHNENVDMLADGGTIYLVHRTAMSQVLGANSSLRFYRSRDGGQSYELLSVIPAPTVAAYPPPSPLGDQDRDLRDPSIYLVGGNLTMKALTRLPVASTRDSNVQTITVTMTSRDGGRTWSRFLPVAPATWSFWRVVEHGGVYYSAAYEDGDLSVKLFTSADGVSWAPGAVIYDVAADTPLETELVFMPSGRLLALVRMDGTNEELLGNGGRLREKVCWAEPPYASFRCPQELTGVRLDGPVAFFHGARLFVIARKHFLEAADRKRTALYELGGTLEGGPLTITEIGELPSAGDTAYAGVARIDDQHVATGWYASDIPDDAPWGRAIFEAADIWKATLDLSRL